MSTKPLRCTYESMGTTWTITVWDALDVRVFDDIRQDILRRSQEFDRTYSRFIPDSLVWTLAKKTGIQTVPQDLTAMLRLYEKFYTLSGGKLTPLIGFTLSDLGYDAEYSLQPHDTIRRPPPLPDALHIIDDVTIALREPVLIDVGALGKGYFVDTIASLLRQRGIRRFLVDGSGDIVYQGDGQPIRVGLEHPGDATKVIGVLDMTHGALCGSGANRRAWRGYHHIVDPQSLQSPPSILSTWVLADSAVLADGLATSLFLTEPDNFRDLCAFQYCILDETLHAKCSAGFPAKLT